MREITREVIEEFTKMAESFSPSDKSFALSMVQQYHRNGLSTKQQWWVGELMERYTDRLGTTGSMTPKKKEYASQDIGAVGRIFGLFDKARAKHVQNPTIRIMVDGHKLKLTQVRGDAPINITEWVNDSGKVWHGALEKSGNLRITDKCGFAVALSNVLKEFAADASKASGVMGKRMRSCCFCGSGLTTTDSLYYGYGPICADNFGLEWGHARNHLRVEAAEEVGEAIKNVSLF